MRNPHYIISLSGGIASAACAVLAHERGLPYSMVFADTRIEDYDLYRFIDELAVALNKPVVKLVDGRDPWDVFVDERYIGNTRTAHCSQELKTEQVRAWMEKTHFFSDFLVLGMYLDEEDRLERARENWAPQNVCSLLIDYKVFPGDAAELVKRYVPKLPRLYDMGFLHNNCGGMCVRAGQGQFARLLEMRPQFYAEMEDRQEWAMAQIGPTARGFIRVTLEGVPHYMTLKQFREWIQAGGKPANYEMGGCGCFVDDAPRRKLLP